MFYGRRPLSAAPRRHYMLSPSRLLAILLVAAAAAGGPARPCRDGRRRRHGRRRGEVVVRYERVAERRERAPRCSARPASATAHAFAPRTRVLKIRDGESVAETVRELRARPEVATAAPNPIARLTSFIPADPGSAGTPRRLAAAAVELPRPASASTRPTPGST